MVFVQERSKKLMWALVGLGIFLFGASVALNVVWLARG